MRSLSQGLAEILFKLVQGRFHRLVDTPSKLLSVGEALFTLALLRGKDINENHPANVAVIKLDRLGDLVLASQMLADVRRAWPESHISLIVRESLVDLARLCPDVDEVIGAPVKEGIMLYNSDSQEYVSWHEQLIAWLRLCHRSKLWRRRFDVALVPRWETDYYGAVPLAYLTGAQERWGVTQAISANKTVFNSGFDCLLTKMARGRPDQHELLLNRRFLEAFGIRASGTAKLVSWITEESRKKANLLLAAAGVTPAKPIIGLCMGAGYAHKMWPVESYARLCSSVFHRAAIQLVTFGTSAERSLGLQLKEKLGGGVINLEGEMPSNLLPAAVSLCRLYIGSDTGTKHLAAAAELPVFEICCHPLDGDPYLDESPLRFGPWGVPNRVVQPERAIAPCRISCFADRPHCILGVSHEKAAAALRSLLAEIGLRPICLDQG
jgi:heptosyltransferase-2